VSALGYAIGPIIINRKLADAPPIGVVTGSLILATLIYSPFVPFLWPAQPGFHGIIAVSVLGLICTATAFMFFFALIAEIGPARATVIAYINPVVAVILGVAFLDEPFTVPMAIGSVMVIAGSILATYRRSR
jgi:drug/metabolite transporter (DMT)-like permease